MSDIRQRLMTPEHDQSRVTKNEDASDSKVVSHKIVKIATIDTTKVTVLIGEGILRKMLKISTKDDKIATIRTTVINGRGSELTAISKVGFLDGLPQIDKV